MLLLLSTELCVPVCIEMSKFVVAGTSEADNNKHKIDGDDYTRSSCVWMRILYSVLMTKH